MSAPINSDMRLSHGKAIQGTVVKVGDIFLDRSPSALSKPKRDLKMWMTQTQTWVRQNFSPLVLCFFLSDRDDIHDPDGAASSLTQQERDIQLRSTLTCLLEKHVLPFVKRTMDACEDRTVLSQTLVHSLASVRKDWTAFLGTSRLILMSLETESGNQRSSTNQVEIVFRRTFQEVVFRTFREKLVEALHNLVKEVRVDRSKLPNIQSDAQELVKQFFDDLNNNGDGEASATSEWVHTETRKLEDFHNAFIEPYKKSMAEQLVEQSNKFEANNDLLSLLSWIPAARKHESEMIRSIFMNVYPADFEALHNNVLYDFDEKVAAPNALRLVEHQQFGIAHILRILDLENMELRWELTAAPAARGDEVANSPTNNNTNSLETSHDPAVLMRRFHELYQVSSTANDAVMAPPITRLLPKTVLRSNRNLVGGAGGAAAPAVSTSRAAAAIAASSAINAAPRKRAPAFEYFLARIREHGERAWTRVVDSLRIGKFFRGSAAFSMDLIKSLGGILSQKALLCKNICQNNTDVESAYNEGFKAIINSANESSIPAYEHKSNPQAVQAETRAVKYPEVLALFADELIRGTDSNIDDPADWVRELVFFLEDRDIFLEYYRVKLGQRLLSREFTDQVRDREETMVSRIKTVLQNNVGPVNKIISMVSDVRSAADLQRQFEEAQTAVGSSMTVPIDVKVLTFASWPVGKPDNSFIMPKSLDECQQRFERFYTQRNAMKSLRWQVDRGSAIISVSFPKGVKEISMNLYQAAVLLAIDEHAPELRKKGRLCTLSDVAEHTGIPVLAVKDCLAPMIFAPKQEIVRRNVDRSVKLDVGQGFELDPNFQSRVKKLKLVHAVPASSRSSETVTDEQIEASRNQMLDVAIVRIMKSRKEVRMSELVNSTIQAVQRFFIPQPRQIKKQIEGLMMKDFLERSEAERDLYLFKAA